MEYVVMEHNNTQQSGNVGGLPKDRTEWPTEAREAFREVLGGLDGWCRRHDWPKLTNDWVAEEAVRRSWQSFECDRARADLKEIHI